MNFLRTTSTRRLIAGSALSVALVVGGVAVAMALAAAAARPPPAKPLDAAIHDALAAPQARRAHRPHPLHEQPLASGALPTRLAAADRRQRPALAAGDGRMRLELQSDAGDAQITVDRRATSRSTTPRPTPSTRRTSAGVPATRRRHGRRRTACRARPRSLGAHRSSRRARRSRAPSRRRRPASPPTRCASRPKHDAGLLGAGRARLGRRHTACRCTSRSRPPGSSSPVLALDVTDISYGSVDAERARGHAARRREGRRSRLARARRLRRRAGSAPRRRA